MFSSRFRETQSNSHNVKKDRTHKPANGQPNGLQNEEKSPNALTNGASDSDSKSMENGMASNGLAQQQPDQFWEFDAENPIESLEKNPTVPKNCTITRPPPITKPGRSVGQ